VVAALIAAAALVDRDPRRRVTWMTGALALAAVILVQHISDTAQFRSISGNTAKMAVLVVGGAAAVGLLAGLFVRRPDALLEQLDPLGLAAGQFEAADVLAEAYRRLTANPTSQP